MLVKLVPEVYADYVVYEKGKKVLYVQVLKALYGMLVVALLWYKQFCGDLEKENFKFNPYDPCVANRMINGKQHTIRFHVDDLMSSHVDKKVNDNFHKWLNKNYGSYGEVKATRGKKHDYLGMNFDFSEKGKVKIDMIEYVKSMINDFSIKFGDWDTKAIPAANDICKKDDSEELNQKDKKNFIHLRQKVYLCVEEQEQIYI